MADSKSPNFDKWIFPVIKNMSKDVPSLVDQLVGLQPLDAPASTRYFKFVKPDKRKKSKYDFEALTGEPMDECPWIFPGATCQLLDLETVKKHYRRRIEQFKKSGRRDERYEKHYEDIRKLLKCKRYSWVKYDYDYPMASRHGIVCVDLPLKHVVRNDLVIIS